MNEQTLVEVYSIISEYNKRTRDRRDYNIFKVLEMTDREVLMCRVLTDFLNPEGQHGKGDKFLRLFLKEVINREDYEEICSSARVFKEYPITEDRRIDIVIEATDVFIPIEVKIHAGEQKAQCYDYYMYAKRKDNHPKVIYLTKWGTMPSEYSMISTDNNFALIEENIFCISFEKDICNFMRMIIDKEDDWLMKEMAKQYLEAIEEFTVFIDEELQMEVANTLCDNEQNFRSMLVIEQSAKKAKAKLMYSLMEELAVEMETLLEKHGLVKEMKFDWYDYKTQATEGFYAQNESTYPGINYVFTKINLVNEIQVWFRIEIDYYLFAGICLFDGREGGQEDMPSQATKEELSLYMNLERAQYDNWWVKYWYLPTASETTKLEGHKIPNFKEMNEAAILLADKERRRQFVQECVRVIDRELEKIIIRNI